MFRKTISCFSSNRYYSLIGSYEHLTRLTVNCNISNAVRQKRAIINRVISDLPCAIGRKKEYSIVCSNPFPIGSINSNSSYPLGFKEVSCYSILNNDDLLSLTALCGKNG